MLIIWYHHTYRCDDTRGCVMQFWPPDDEHMCSKHVEAWNKLIVKQKFCVSSWLITEINILRCTVSKTSKHVEAWNKLIVKQKFCASSWLITEINILRCTVSKTSKNVIMVLQHMWMSYQGWRCTAFLWLGMGEKERAVVNTIMDNLVTWNAGTYARTGNSTSQRDS